MDPQVLSPQFDPIFQRLRFLLVPFDGENDGVLSGLGVELASFVEGFSMGAYYSSRIMSLTSWPQPRPHTEQERQQALAENALKYVQQLHRNRDRILELCIELLRYQSWPIFRGEPWGPPKA